MEKKWTFYFYNLFKESLWDYFLWAGIISLSLGVALSIYNILESNETKDELKKTKERLDAIERTVSKKDIKEIKEKLGNIENIISDINISSNKKN